VDGFGIPIPGQGRGECILFIEQPGIPHLGREQDNLPDRNDSTVVSGCTPLNVAYLIGETKILALTRALVPARRAASPIITSTSAMKFF
jgi:hypothetical protein